MRSKAGEQFNAPSNHIRQIEVDEIPAYVEPVVREEDVHATEELAELQLVDGATAVLVHLREVPLDHLHLLGQGFLSTARLPAVQYRDTKRDI